MTKLTRSQLYMMASAKAQVQAAVKLLADAIGLANSADPDAPLTKTLRKAYEAAVDAREAVFKRLEGEADDE